MRKVARVASLCDSSRVNRRREWRCVPFRDITYTEGEQRCVRQVSHRLVRMLSFKNTDGRGNATRECFRHVADGWGSCG